MRHVLISQEELQNIRELYEGVMSNASHGLFFKEGSIIGIGIATLAIKDRAKFFQESARILKERSWVKEIDFSDHTVKASGSIEASAGRVAQPTCHRLRGILRKLYETYRDQKVYCKETECASTGADRCVFEIGTMELWK